MTSKKLIFKAKNNIFINNKQVYFSRKMLFIIKGCSLSSIGVI